MISFFQSQVGKRDENLVKWLNYLEITRSVVHKGSEHPRTPHYNRFAMVVATSIFLRNVSPSFRTAVKIHNLVLSVANPSANCKRSCPTQAFFHLPEATRDKKMKCRP